MYCIQVVNYGDALPDTREKEVKKGLISVKLTLSLIEYLFTKDQAYKPKKMK